MTPLLLVILVEKTSGEPIFRHHKFLLAGVGVFVQHNYMYAMITKIQGFLTGNVNQKISPFRIKIRGKTWVSPLMRNNFYQNWIKNMKKQLNTYEKSQRYICLNFRTRNRVFSFFKSH